MEGRQAWRFTSPLLDVADQTLRECPISVVLREAPHVFEAIPLCSYVSDSGSVPLFDLSSWARSAIRIVGAEKARLFEQKQQSDKSKRDSDAGIEARKAR